MYDSERKLTAIAGPVEGGPISMATLMFTEVRSLMDGWMCVDTRLFLLIWISCVSLYYEGNNVMWEFRVEVVNLINYETWVVLVVNFSQLWLLDPRPTQT